MQGQGLGPLATVVAGLMLTAALAACGSAAAPPSAAAGSVSHAAGASSGHGSLPSRQAATTATQARILAAARRVKCPADGNGVISVPGRGQPAEPIPAGFRPVAVVECVRVPVMVPIAGTPIVELRRVAVAGLGRLLAALRLPSTPRSRGLVPACLTPVAALPSIVLISAADQLVRPRVPIGLCGEPIVPVLASLASLHWRTLSATKGVSVGPHLRVQGSPFPNMTPAISGPQS